MKLENFDDNMLIDMLKHLDDDVSVPDDVQSAWRAAIKKEAKYVRLNRTIKYVSGIAAVLVVFLSATILFRNIGVVSTVKESEPSHSLVYTTDTKSRGIAAIETDGNENDANGIMLASKISDDAAGIIIAEDSTEELPIDSASENCLMLTNANCSFSSKSSDLAKIAIEQSIKGFDAYIADSFYDQYTYNASVRVRREETESFLANLSSNVNDFSCTFTIQPADSGSYDAESRIDAAYAYLDTLKTAIVNADPQTASELYHEMETVLAQIDDLDRIIFENKLNTTYSRVEIKANIGNLTNRITSALTSFINGFGTDLVVTIIILLPLFIIAFTSYILLSKKKK